jgi:hypothetical protein
MGFGTIFSTYAVSNGSSAKSNSSSDAPKTNSASGLLQGGGGRSGFSKNNFKDLFNYF